MIEGEFVHSDEKPELIKLVDIGKSIQFEIHEDNGTRLA